jgi:hypothetical protein
MELRQGMTVWGGWLVCKATVGLLNLALAQDLGSDRQKAVWLPCWVSNSCVAEGVCVCVLQLLIADQVWALSINTL